MAIQKKSSLVLWLGLAIFHAGCIDFTIKNEKPDASDVTAQTCRSERYGVCWHLGERGQNCVEVCASHGGYDPATASHIGTPDQGGSLENCEAVLNSLGIQESPGVGNRENGGLGCHNWDRDRYWWLDAPSFDPEDSYREAARVCGCLK